MKIVSVTRRERFSASHRLFNPLWEDDKNEEVLENAPTKTGMGITIFFM